MRFEIITIFPAFFAGIFEHGIVRRAQAEGLISVNLHDLRNFTHDRHRTVDDRPFGGGEGMVLKPEPLAEALEHLGIAAKADRGQLEKQILRLPPPNLRKPFGGPCAQDDTLAPQVILLSAQGRQFTQGVARDLAMLDRVVLICGRYEGVDERVAEHLADDEVSIGNYVLSGGELPAAIVIDAVARLLPGVLGNETSAAFDSFQESGHGEGLLDCPHWTRPADFRGWKAPEALLNGNHEEIRKFRRKAAREKTARLRPDLAR